ncbi:hypothetical protein F5877DRAFT_69026 [Lentinula edodes]|nr:hypothetical protein F5877DRAFT_69026 [Lentinula edodes]
MEFSLLSISLSLFLSTLYIVSTIVYMEPLQGSHLSIPATTRSFPSSVAVSVAPFELQPAPSTLQCLTGPVLKRCKTNNGGRQAQDEAFWGRFDKCLKEKIDDYGQNMKVGKWKEYFCETVQADWERFGKPSNTLLPALPIAANNNGTTTGRAPLAEVPNNAHSVPRVSGVEDGLANHDDEYTQF